MADHTKHRRNFTRDPQAVVLTLHIDIPIIPICGIQLCAVPLGDILIKLANRRAVILNIRILKEYYGPPSGSVARRTTGMCFVLAAALGAGISWVPLTKLM